MVGARSVAVAAILLLVSAVATALAFPPWGLRLFAFVSLVPLFVVIRKAKPFVAIVAIVLWTEAYAWAIASIFPTSLASFYEQSEAFGVVVASTLFFLMAGIYYAAFAVVDRRLGRSPNGATPLLVAGAWVGAELLRARLFTGSEFFIGNPWGLIGYSHASGVLAQVAALGGVYAISFALVAVNAGIAGMITAPRGGAGRRSALRGLAVSIVPVTLCWGYGTWTLERAPEVGGADLPRVAVVQGNVSIDRRWRSDFHGKNLDVYLRLTVDALRDDDPDLVVWPETSLNFFLEAEPRYRAAIAATLRGSAASLLVGGPSGQGDKRPPYFNSVFHLDGQGEILGRYDKSLLVPFSETFPASSSQWMRRRIEGARTFEPGPEDPVPLDTPIGRVGLLICNEAMLPEIARRRVVQGAEILISPSNDSWIAGRAFGEHMLAVVALRAIETRRDLVRASTSGPSAVVDAWGRVVARTEVMRAAVLVAGVRARDGLSIYTRLGDAFAAGLGLFALAAASVPMRKQPATPHPTGAPT